MSTTARTSGGTTTDTVYQEQIVTSSAARKVLAVARITIGFTFFWAFIDKVFGLGYATPAERAWINGGTPAQGFIGGIEGPFAGFFQLFANPFGDWLFMLGLLGIGVALIFGAGLKIAAVTGTLLMLLMYLAQFPLVLGGTNPIVDSHWHEALLLIISAVTLAGDTWGVGRIWGRMVGNSWLR
ncbi:DoxX family protein [Cellulomonas shaoxiangyii]|uniref:DoxX family protein n=1 Tax=Cellulomonas shaoxiangyii TaxID=2566013 RepID=A0A4P7SJK0_9CELL|nr:DoxX family protein [Cellulomonas shaoxiangyii]QCB93878.1 DoxX family protein [Cellulomonas shaoxiangyii]TGY83210.1 DoxX family protein [Cellulomonas shaoxiangyii]